MEEEEKKYEDKYVYTKIQLEDGTITDAILVAVDAKNVRWRDGSDLIGALAKKASRKIYQDTGIIFDDNNIGEAENVAIVGKSIILTANNSFAMGKDNHVSKTKDKDIIIQNNFIEGQNNTMIDTSDSHIYGSNNSISNGISHTMHGYNNKIKADEDGYGIYAEGKDNNLTGTLSQSYGISNIVNGVGSTAIGEGNIVDNDNNLTIGQGLKNYIPKDDEENEKSRTIKGHFNKEIETNEKTGVGEKDYYYVVGNGTDDENRSNAIEVGPEWMIVTGDLKSPKGFFGPFERTLNKKKITSYIKDVQIQGKELHYFIGGGFERIKEFEDWQHQRIEEKFSYWTAPDTTITIAQGAKPKTILDLYYYNNMTIYEEVPGWVESEHAQFTKATKKTNDALLMMQLWIEVEKVNEQDDAILKLELVHEGKSAYAGFGPIYSLKPGHHILHLNWPLLNAELDKVYHFEINAYCTSGTITINPDKTRILVYGEGVGIGKEIPKKEEIEGGETE